MAIVTISVDEDVPSLDVGDLDLQRAGPALDSDDVLDMHLFLRRFDGDFRSLFDGASPHRSRDAA